ncbi:MAG: HEAT repeat domain-containing protein [Thermoanaerobaculia bacterium]
MNCEAMQENLVRRLAGDLPADESRALDRHLGECADCRAEAESLGALWNGLGELSALPEAQPSPAMGERFRAMLDAEIARQQPAPLPFRAPSAAPAAASGSVDLRRWLPLAAVLAFGLGLGWLFWGRGDSDQIALQSLQQEVGELHELVAESLLAKSSVSERLQGVAYGREYSAGDPGVAAALVKALTDDSNVNVRLAALEALRPLATRERYRTQLVAVAASPDSPLVSLSVIDVLLEAGTPEARHDLEQLLKDPNLDPVVRGYLRDRLGRSI